MFKVENRKFDSDYNCGLIGLVGSVRQWLKRSGFNPRSSHTKDFKNGTWYLLA